MSTPLQFKELTVRHTVKPSIRHCYLRVHGDGTVEVRSPRIAMHKVMQLLEEREGWIRKKLAELDGKERLEHEAGNEVSYLGLLHPIHGNPAFDDLEAALGRLRSTAPEALQRCYDAFYRRRAEDYIPERLAALESSYGLQASALRVRKMKRRWGSCSSRGVITISTSVMRLPEILIDYIIVHELAHLRQMNHSAAFYAEVARMLPEYKTLEKELRRYQLG
jgi:predicted metal-dependent hydrolase